MAFETEWTQVENDVINGVERKLYRDLFIPQKTIVVDNSENNEADHLAFTYLRDEQFSNKILDSNKIIICDMLADLSEMKEIKIPVY